MGLPLFRRYGPSDWTASRGRAGIRSASRHDLARIPYRARDLSLHIARRPITANDSRGGWAIAAVPLARCCSCHGRSSFSRGVSTRRICTASKRVPKTRTWQRDRQYRSAGRRGRFGPLKEGIWAEPEVFAQGLTFPTREKDAQRRTRRPSLKIVRPRAYRSHDGGSPEQIVHDVGQPQLRPDASASMA